MKMNIMNTINLKLEHIMWMSLKTVIVIALGFIALKLLQRATGKFLDRAGVDLSLHRFVKNSIKALIIVGIIISSLSVWGVNTTTFVAVLGAAGAAVALALKDSLGNIAGGIIILVTKPFKKGDYIDIIDTAGVVEEIDLLYTTLKTFDNKVISVPNGRITTAVLTNFTEEDTRRVDCSFGIGYDDDVNKAKAAMLEVVRDNKLIFSDPEPFVKVVGYSDSSVKIDLRVWCETDKYWEVKYYLEENVKRVFDRDGISMPYTQIEIHQK